MSEDERIERAAVLKDGVVYDVERPLRHDAAIRKAFDALQDQGSSASTLGDHEQGFVTSAGRFVGRWQAARIAFRAGQTPALKRLGLTSEDVW